MKGGNDERVIPQLLDIHESFCTKGSSKQLTFHLATKFRPGASAFLFSGNKSMFATLKQSVYVKVSPSEVSGIHE
jgi:hypothetical protein